MQLHVFLEEWGRGRHARAHTCTRTQYTCTYTHTHTGEKCGPSRGRVGLPTPSFHPSDNSRRLLAPMTVREHLLLFYVGGNLLQKPQEIGTYWEAVIWEYGKYETPQTGCSLGWLFVPLALESILLARSRGSKIVSASRTILPNLGALQELSSPVILWSQDPSWFRQGAQHSFWVQMAVPAWWSGSTAIFGWSRL